MTIYEAIGTVAVAMDVNYIYGSPKEVQKRLNDMYLDPALRAERYPCLVLFTNIPGNVQPGGVTEYECTLAFLMTTDKNYTTVERLEYVYKVTLYPMVADFLTYLKRSQYLGFDELDGYEQTDAFYYSATPAQEQNTLSAILDAVEIKNLRLKLYGCADDPNYRITETGAYRLTEDGQIRIIE